MLGAGQDRVLRQGLADLGTALVALDHGGGEFSNQHRIFAKGLVHAAPAGVAGDAQHRRKRPMYTTSSAVARPAALTLSGSQLTAMPSWDGKIVAPGQKEYPWMQSSPIINGMPKRVFSLTVLAARDKSSGLVCRMDPTCHLLPLSSTSLGSRRTANQRYLSHIGDSVMPSTPISRNRFFCICFFAYSWNTSGCFRSPGMSDKRPSSPRNSFQKSSGWPYGEASRPWAWMLALASNTSSSLMPSK